MEIKSAKILLISDDKEKMFFNKIKNIFKNDKSINLIYSNSSTHNLNNHMFFDLSMIFIDYEFLNTDIEELLSFIISYLSYKPFVIIFSKKQHNLSTKNIYENALIFSKPIDENFYNSTKNMLDILRYKLDISDVTLLPGLLELTNVLEEKFDNNENFSLLYIDIDKFKSFTDYYGLKRATELLIHLSQIIINVMSEYVDFLNNIYNIGGDDFAIILADDHNIKELGDKIIERFDEIVPKYYDDEDLRKGYISVLNREGIYEDFSLISLSIISVTNNFNKYHSIMDIYNEMKQLKYDAKQFGGSILLQTD